MTEKKPSMRVWLFSVLAVLFIRLLAHGPAVASRSAGADTGHAGFLNQTIPTMTPTGPAVTPPTAEPTKPSPTRELTKPPPTQEPTRPPPEPSGTAFPTATHAPSKTPTPTTETTVDEPSSPTPVPPASTETTLPERTPVRTESPGEPTSHRPPLLTPMATASPSVVRSSTPARPSQTPNLQAPLEATGAPVPAASTAIGSPCLWISLGLVLILAGIVMLVRQRASA